MIPTSFTEFREALLEDLHRTVFDTEIKIFFGTMDTPCFRHEQFGEICAFSKWLPSLDYVGIRDLVIEMIGRDLLLLTNPKYEKFTEYHLWIYQVPTPDPDFPCIRYGKHVF